MAQLGAYVICEDEDFRRHIDRLLRSGLNTDGENLPATRRKRSSCLILHDHPQCAGLSRGIFRLGMRDEGFEGEDGGLR